MKRPTLLARIVGLCFLLSVVQCTVWSQPDFYSVFSEPSELARSSDAARTLEALEGVEIPATEQHHEQLLELARTEDLSTDQLLLLTHAVCTAPGRGEDFRGYVDRILLAGADRVSDLDPTNAGRILGRSQSQDTVRVLTLSLLPMVDDGSARALSQLLEGVSDTPVHAEVVNELLATGRAEDERAFQAVRSLGTPEARWSGVQRMIADEPEISVPLAERYFRLMGTDEYQQQALELLAPRLTLAPAGELLSLVQLFVYDTSRGAAVAMLAPRIQGPVTADELGQWLDSVNYQSNRAAVIEHLVPRCEPLSLGEVLATAKVSSFEHERAEIIMQLATTRTLTISGDDLAGAVVLAGEDRDRLKLIRLLRPRLTTLSSDNVESVLGAFGGDGARLKGLAVLREHISPGSDMHRFTGLFSANARSKAQGLLDF